MNWEAEVHHFFPRCAVLLAAMCFYHSVYANGTGPGVSTRAMQNVTETIRHRVVEAEKFCENVPMEPVVAIDPANITAKNPSGKLIVERPIILCAHKASDDTWHAVTVYLPRPVPDTYKNCLTKAEVMKDREQCVLPMRIATPGYDVERIGFGYGITRFTATVTENTPKLNGEKLTVYRTKHLWFDDDAIRSGDTERILATMRPVYYTPYHPDFHKPEVVKAGEELLRDEAMRASDELRRLNVPSLAYPGRLVADVVPWKVIFALALIEQMDDLEFKSDQKRATESRFVEHFLNGADACRFCQSDKGAFGLMQFTNTGTNGTYDTVRAKYPLAAPLSDFPDAVRDHNNAMKAAFCLIDLEVAQLPEIRAVFKKDPLLAAVYPVAAYNGGHGRARELHLLLRNKKLSIATLSRLDQSISIKVIRKCDKCPKGKRTFVETVQLNGETFGYVRKYVHILKEHLLHMK